MQKVEPITQNHTNMTAINKANYNDLLEEIKLKLIGHSCFANDNFKPEAAEAVDSVVKSMIRWINEKQLQTK
jgi:hypothetical protein